METGRYSTDHDMNLDELATKYATFQGDPESESILINHKADEKEGYVIVWAGRGRDIRGILRRCRSAILSFEDRGYGVEVGGYDVTLKDRGRQGCEDWMLYLAIAERYDVDLVPEFLVGYRITDTSMSTNAREMKRSYELLMVEVRRRHPELPNRLFRWSEGFMCFWLGHRCLRRARLLSGLPLLARTIIRDPGFLFQPPLRRAVGNLVAKLLRRLYRGPKTGAKASRRPFLAYPSQPQTAVSTDIGLFDRRRQTFVASLRICRK